MADTNQIVAEWRQKHGDVQGQPFVTDPTIKSTTTNRLGDPVTTESPNPDPVYRYTFADGSTLDITGQSGQIKNADEKPPRNPPNQTINDPRTGEPLAVTTASGASITLPKPTAPQGWTETQWFQNSDGSKTLYGRDPADGKFKKVPDLPNSAATPSTATKPPSDPSKWQQIKAPDGRVIAMQDPVTGDRVAVPTEPTDKNSPAGTPRDTFEGGRQITWVADGNGNWSIKTIGQPLADPTKPKDGDTRPNVASGYEIREVYRGGAWVTDPSFTPKPYDPNLATKPKEGDKRPNVIQGQQVSQVYRGGEWVVDPSVQPTPYGPQTDPTQEITRLQALAQAERDRINAQPISDEAKRAAFDDWWQTNIEPARASLQQKQDQQHLTDSRDVLSTVNSGAQTGASLLNQRVASGTGLLNNLTSLAGNSKITAVPAGLGGQLVSGVQDWVTQMGGGQDVYNAAAEMVHQANPSLKGTTLGAQASAAIGQILDRQRQQRVSDGFGSYTPGAQPAGNAMGVLNPTRYTFGGGGQAALPVPQSAQQPTITINVGNAPISGPQATDDPYGRLNARI